MKKEKVKRFWKKHNKTIKKVVVLAVVPIPAIVLYTVCSKFIDKHTKELGDLYENGYGVK